MFNSTVCQMRCAGFRVMLEQLANRVHTAGISSNMCPICCFTVNILGVCRPASRSRFFQIEIRDLALDIQDVMVRFFSRTACFLAGKKVASSLFKMQILSS